MEKLDTDIKTNDTVQTEITDIPETTGIPDISQSDEEFVVTPNGKKYHDPDCGAVKTIKEYLKKEQAVEKGYEPCAICKPDGYVTK